MAKFLYFQDMHLSGKNSANYISNYFEDCLEMFDEILSIAKKEKVEVILDGGDIFHTYAPSYNVIDEIADRVEKYKIPIHSLFGNHATKYHSAEHSSDTGLSHLFKRSKYFKHMKHLKCGNKFEILPIEYSHEVEEDIKKNGIVFKDTKRWKIAIVHAFVCPKEFPYASHVVCNDIKTDADIVLVAHYHSQWKKKVGNTEFVDIGCLGRRSITEKDIEPTVLLIDTDNRSIKEIKLKSAKKAEEIFDLSKLEEIKEMDADLEAFIKSLESETFQSANLKDIINQIAKEKKYSKDVVDLILEKLGENYE